MTTVPIDRMPPHSAEAEEAVLGSILIDPDALDRVGFLTGMDFYIVKHGWLWDACSALHAKRLPVDALTLRREMEMRGQIDEIGGPAYITYLMTTVPTAIHAEGYARLVVEAANRRRLLAAAIELAQLAYDENTPPHRVNDLAEQIVFKARRVRDERSAQPLSEAVLTYFERVEYLHDHGVENIGVPTGLVDLDMMLGGLQRSDLVVVAARPGVGKTSLILNIALAASQRFHYCTLVMSLEMSHEQVTERLVAQSSGIDSQKLRFGQLADDDWPLLVQATSRLGDVPLWIDDTPGLSIGQVRAKARRMQAARGLDLLVIDYLQLMASDRRTENRNQEIAAISQGLKNLARELNIPVLVASQLSRGVEQRSDKRPMLSDLRDSGAIEQDSDVILFIYRDDIYNPESDKHHLAELIIAKQRKGPTGTVEVYWDKAHTQFRSLARYEG